MEVNAILLYRKINGLYKKSSLHSVLKDQQFCSFSNFWCHCMNAIKQCTKTLELPIFLTKDLVEEIFKEAISMAKFEVSLWKLIIE